MGKPTAKLPEKLYYSIREVASHTGVEPHVLRYWESEFPSLRPKRSRAGSRNYRKKDIEEILKIQALLHEEGYRIEGARKHLLELRRGTAKTAKPPQMAIPFTQLDQSDKLKEIRRSLKDIQGMLKDMQE